MNKDDDLEKLDFYLNAKFEFTESILVSNLVIIPERTEFIKMLNTLNKYEIEMLYNHFHMSSITEDINRQRKYVVLIWNRWRLFFEKNMSEKNIIIKINDSNFEVVIYACEA